jgi:CRISPR-associated protein Cas5d
MNTFLVEVKVWGRYACFTRPENKVERLSYPLITPSAAVGVLEAIYWKPQFRWEVTEIGVLRHPERGDTVDWQNYMPITLNELADGDTHPVGGYELQRHRVQRTCLILRWPAYRIRARARIFTDTTNPAAIKRQFDYRVRTGQCYWQPYLGLREFTAYFGPIGSADAPVASLTTGDLGYLVHSATVPAGATAVSYRFIELRLNRGVLNAQLPVRRLETSG